MAMTPTKEAAYVLAYGSREDLRSDEARAEYDRLKAEQAAQGPRPPQSARPRRSPAEEAIRAYLIKHWIEPVTPFVVLIVGIIMQAATGSKVALCNSFVGQIGQAFDRQASTGCSVASGVHTFGQVLMWLGILGLIGAAARLWAAYDKVAKARARLAQQGSQAAPEA